MKLVDIIKAQKKFDKLAEEIKGLRELDKKLTNIYINVTSHTGGSEFVKNCRNQIRDECTKLHKEQEIIEVW